MLHNDAINESKFNRVGGQFRNLVLCVTFKIFIISKLHFQIVDFSRLCMLVKWSGRIVIHCYSSSSCIQPLMDVALNCSWLFAILQTLTSHSVVFRMWSSWLCLDLSLCCSSIQTSLIHPFCELPVFFHCCSYLLIKQFHAHYICLVIILSCRHDICPSLSIFIFRYNLHFQIYLWAYYICCVCSLFLHSSCVPCTWLTFIILWSGDIWEACILLWPDHCAVALN